jgi:dihydrofolate synthase/folylpolyglutamate synthase
MPFTSFSDVTAHLDRLGLFHMDLSSDRMEQALAALDLNRADGAPVVQIVGTNGKGSTAAFLDRLVREHGLKAGMYTSPHFVRVNERIRINGVPLADEEWTEPANAVHAAYPGLTYFEFLTVLAVLVFTRANVDCLILEAGLGGEHDATTAVRADLVCFTPIAMDHAHILGPDLEHIAADKAGAMRPGGLTLTAPQRPEVMRLLQAKAQDKRCALLEAGDNLPGELGMTELGLIKLGLAGPFQRGNAALALAAWRALAGACAPVFSGRPRWPSWSTDADAEIRGLTRAFIPGRLQRVPPAADLPPPLPPSLPSRLLDGAHNGHGLASLKLALEALHIRPRAIIFTCLADKDTQLMLPRVRDLGALGDACPILVPGLPGNARARQAAELAVMLGANARPCADAYAALAEAARLVPQPAPRPARRLVPRLSDSDDDPILICGSLYLLAEIFRMFPRLIEEPAL